MTNFARALATTSSRAAIGVALVSLGASPLFAQTGSATPGPAPVSDTAATATAAQPSTTIDDSKTIVVTGFRAALRSATARKKKTETVVESVTAEDIGKLPDNSIAESIARLPGLAAQRNNGRATIISIRGFGPDFSTTTLNGRQQTTTNDDRAVEFDQYPSEILAGVDIYKTSEADHTAGGLVGSIDLRTIRPLDYGKRVIAVGVRGAYVDQKLLPGSKDKGFRVFGTYVDQFADGNVGVALSAAYTDEPYQTRDYNAWGYADGGARNDPTNKGVQGLYGIKTWFEADQLKRLGGTATVQGRLSDNLTMTFDGFYSHYVDNIDQKGFEMPLGYGQGHEAFLTSTATNGIITSATTVGTPLIENYATDRKADQYAFGWNALWDGHNGWKALVDLSMSRTNRTEHHIEETAGLAYGRDLTAPTATVSFVTTNHGPEFTSNYNGANPALVLTDVEGWSGGSFVQAGYDKVRTSKDDLKEARGEIERDFDSFIKAIKIGVDYTDRSKKLSQVDGFLAPPVGQTTAAIPSSLIGPSFTLDRGFGPILNWDPRGVENQNILRYIPNIYPNGYNVTEKVFTPYVMAPLQAQLGGADLTGNIGLQGVHTDLVSKSASFPTAHDKYWMWLPSLNLNLRWNNGWVVRAAASKEYMRPRLNDLNNAINFHYDVTLNAYNGGGGNPFLRPYQAKALDFTVEKYFGSNGYIALQSFYKHIDNYIASGFVTNFDYSQFPPPPNERVPPTPIGRFGGQVNTHGGYMYGAELAGTLPFDVFSSSLDGFGLTGGAGYTKTKIRDFNGNTSVIPGYSKWVANLTAFYEKSGFNARASMRYRSGFQGDFVLFSGSLDRQQVLAETIYDAQIGYDFQPDSALSGLSVFLQGQNLTDERQATIAIPSAPESWLKYQTYGRRFLVGATYKFGGRAAPLPVVAPPPPPPPPPVATQTCPDGSVILATDVCPPPPPPPPPPPAPAATGERG